MMKIVLIFLFYILLVTSVTSMPQRMGKVCIPIVASNIDEIGRSSRAVTTSSEDASTWGTWVLKTGAIGGIICLIPMPGTVTFPMRLGVLTIIMATLIVESGTDKTSKSISDVGKGISDAGNGVGMGIAIGLTAIALSMTIGSYWEKKERAKT